MRIQSPKTALLLLTIACGPFCGCASVNPPVEIAQPFAWSAPRKSFVNAPPRPSETATFITTEKVRDLARQACVAREVEKRNGEVWIGSVSRKDTAAIEMDDRKCRAVLGSERVL